MDSTCLALHHLALGRAVHLMSFDYGQKHCLELQRLDANLALFERKALPVAHTRVSVPFGAFAASALTTSDHELPRGFYAEENMKETVVPNRNAIFMSLCYAKALSLATEAKGPVLLSLGVHAGDHAIYPDCRVEFFHALHGAFILGNWGGDAVSMDLPFIDFDKAAILRRGLFACEVLGLDFDEVLANTSTSYAPTAEGLADGKTGSDVERILAFHEIGRMDPVQYVDGWEAALSYALQAQRDFEGK